jgi:formamidopyrimidine-DNA glycosylase
MIAGRFHWKMKPTLPTGKNDLLAIATDRGTMMFTEASSKKRAGLWIVNSMAAVDAIDPDGLNVLECQFAEFQQRLCSKNNTLKRALADPRRFSGIGNAYSDEILHAARLSPLRRTQQLTEEETKTLFAAVRSCLREWIARLAKLCGERFPEKVTAFRPEMAVHGRFGKPCPQCKTPVQRIRYSENECNYCARCQTGGKLLADRSLSRLLKDDWPRTIEEWES